MKLILSAMLVTAVTVAVAVACAPPAATPSPTSTSTPTAAASTTTPVTATITGLAGYPAEGNPAMTIYAVSTTDRSVYFTVDVPRGTVPAKPPFTITGVRPGTYHLFAYVEGNDGAAGGAYTESVKCGNRVGCNDHTPIDVTVRAGETVRDIEVSDWYAPPGTFPPRPR